ncbi:MAG: glutamine-hydrolyzing GMP synthase [Bdellovibrionia bacterium]
MSNAINSHTSSSHTKHATVIILDYGSQYTQLITRRVRELGFYSRILPADVSLERLAGFSPRAIVLSGGPSSVYDSDAPQLPLDFLKYQEENKIPLLGICYGMQLLAKSMGGEVKKAKVREYGRMEVRPSADSEFFSPSIQVESKSSATPEKSSGRTLQTPFTAWMSHGDETEHVPSGFTISARSASGSIAAMENRARQIYAFQFHAEVTHTENGRDLLARFLIGLGGLRPDWDMGSVLEEKIVEIRAKVGPTDHVICALSGGVDSAVAATLVRRAIGDRLHCFFIDNGLLRLDEQKRVMEMFSKNLHLPVTCLDHSERFLNKLQGVSDPEQKRKIIGSEFISSFEEAAQMISQTVGSLPQYLVQGTLYPDVVESSPGHKHAATIKSHHNVGGLPKNLRFQLIEPFCELFKDEVREMGRRLNVPESFLRRHPFPGPGLAVRVIGEITTPSLELLRQIDEVFINAIREEGLYDQIWQAFAVFLPIKSVGVQGDGRTHDHVIALRAVTSSDGMTADWYPFEAQFLAKVSSRICIEIRGVNRVVFDISSKPPATIEWE